MEHFNDDVERALTEFLVDRFPGLAAAGVQAETPLLEGGHLDSLGVVDVMLFLEERYALRIPDGDVIPEYFAMVASLARLVRRRRAD